MNPSPADIANAEAAYEAFAGRFGMAHDRADYVARLAEAAMHKRLNAEHRAMNHLTTAIQAETKRREAA